MPAPDHPATASHLSLAQRASSTLVRSGTPSTAHRFGAAAYLLDRLDTRPIAQRMPDRPWWHFW